MKITNKKKNGRKAYWRSTREDLLNSRIKERELVLEQENNADDVFRQQFLETQVACRENRDPTMTRMLIFYKEKWRVNAEHRTEKMMSLKKDIVELSDWLVNN